ncbi:hypothetical protein G7K_6392-t1 [Saitoella complicata NRRL Y-17804]|uniref:Uncharacterized protein n=1 Tax=Saitoella complicata (strain BCRC 22490 / CBS 7301 / JCM 7358 / NBRC 10748 / NRRL Y-17804) TaxID=698492 RepID=A0A0E9NR72_SAICN|nr:hypothetical protein G7K_6392-t1 [Saitoella complicata NRRL Y-17804]
MAVGLFAAVTYVTGKSNPWIHLRFDVPCFFVAGCLFDPVNYLCTYLYQVPFSNIPELISIPNDSHP